MHGEHASEYVSEREPMVGADGELDEGSAAIVDVDLSVEAANEVQRRPSAAHKNRCRRRGGVCCCCCLLTIGLAGVIMKALWDALPETSPVRLWPRQFAGSQLFNTLLQPSATAHKGRDYFATQLPLMEASARSFDCLDYWCKNLSVPSVHTDWYTLLTHRYDSMLAKLRADPRADDFRMEKDKCDMYDWFELNGFRAMRVIYRWSARGEWGTTPSTEDAVIRDLLDNRTGHEFPMFMKMCHITQGWQHATRLLKSRASVVANRAELEGWVSQLWRAHANDWERPWAAAHNALTDTLGPGVMVQELYSGHFVANLDPAAELDGAVVEMKVYVIWGHAYMGSIHDIILLRDGTMEQYVGYLSMLHGHRPAKNLRWVATEGHLERAFFMAETAAMVAGMDMIRMDFFVRKGDPAGIAFNENSISSARSPIYHHHFDYMSYAWARGHIERWYRPFNAGGKRTYELSMHDDVHPNRQRIRDKLATNQALAEEVGLHI